jgi:Tfp pilus assembly protein PilV
MKTRIKMRRFCSKSAKGYTLTEVLVASALLIAVSVPMLKALTTGYVFSNSIKYKTKSVVYAKSRLDRVRAIAANQYNTSLTETNTSLGEGYLCSVSDTGFAGDIRTISVWSGFDKNGNGMLDSDEIQITLTTLIARR